MSRILEAIARRARHQPNDIAIADQCKALSYEGLWHELDDLSGHLVDLFKLPGPVAFALDNSLAWVLLDLGLIALGRPSVPLPPFFTLPQQSHVLAHTGAAYLITDQPLAGQEHIETISIVGRVLYVFEQHGCRVALPASTAKITFTSGSTGQPKGVCLSQHGMEKLAQSLVDFIGTDYAGIHCAILPLAVLLENVAGLYPTLLAGGCYYVKPLASIGFKRSFMPDFEKLVCALEDCSAASIIVVPEILRGLMAALESTGLTLPAMKLLAVGGAKVSAELLQKAEALGLPVFQGYGLSEAASVVAFNRPGDNRLGCVGKILPELDLQLSDDGEILINRPAFLGYIGDVPAPMQFATGDIGHFDHDGYLYIDGRKSNLLVTAFGRNVSPEWVESELLAHHSIGQAFVFGDGAPSLAALIAPSSTAVSDADIAVAIDRSNRNLPEYAHIRHWSKVMPFTIANQQLTSNGRLQRSRIAKDHKNTMEKSLPHTGQYAGFFERLISETASERAYLQQTPQILDGLAGKISRETYLSYLAEAYHHVKHTIPLLNLMRAKLLPRQVGLQLAVDEYIAEETGHDEWILEDIANAGGDADKVRHGEPRFPTELMVSYAYDFISRINPAGFFGMVFVLESTSTQLAVLGAGALMKSLQLPEDCFHYLLSHGTLDIDHLKFLESLMPQIDHPDDQDAIIHMAKAIFILYSDIFRSIPHQREMVDAA
jgi:long-chain acyl-CoA synthetase